MNRSNDSHSDKRVSSIIERNTGENPPEARVDPSRSKDAAAMKPQTRAPSAPSTSGTGPTSGRGSQVETGPSKH